MVIRNVIFQHNIMLFFCFHKLIAFKVSNFTRRNISTWFKFIEKSLFLFLNCIFYVCFYYRLSNAYSRVSLHHSQHPIAASPLELLVDLQQTPLVRCALVNVPGNFIISSFQAVYSPVDIERDFFKLRQWLQQVQTGCMVSQTTGAQREHSCHVFHVYVQGSKTSTLEFQYLFELETWL